MDNKYEHLLMTAQNGVWKNALTILDYMGWIRLINALAVVLMEPLEIIIQDFAMMFAFLEQM